MKSILQDWVQNLGLRHQGVLVSAVRGCDTAIKEDPSKALVRCYRAAILNAHCGEAKKAATYIEVVDWDELLNRMERFRKSMDHYPLHYVLHFMHAAEIVGCKGPKFDSNGKENSIVFAEAWKWFYAKMCRSLHLNLETEKELDARLNASEEDFAHMDRS